MTNKSQTRSKGRTNEPPQPTTRIHYVDLASGIRRTPEFEKKGLATHAVNIGLKCSHDCRYCSTGASVRTHKAFKAAGESPFGFGYALINVNMPEKITKDAPQIPKTAVVQLCTTVDAWAPEAQEHDLGRKCMEALLTDTEFTVRVLTKNAAVVKDFDLIQKHRDRVLVGLSLTGTQAKEGIIKVVEPNASTISERMAALKRAHDLELRTYGMLCPLLPGVSDSYDDILKLVGFVKECGAEEVYAEAVNPRGRGLIETANALRAVGHGAEADAVDRVRKKASHEEYVQRLIGNVQKAVREHGMIDKLRFLLYGSGLSRRGQAANRVGQRRDRVVVDPSATHLAKQIYAHRLRGSVGVPRHGPAV